MNEEKGCKAFIESFHMAPLRDGPLSSLRFAVKDLIDIAGKTTGCGNPSWLATHKPANRNAPCVEQLLNSGATCVGKTITDELAFSIIGANHFYGTPLNPKAPDRVPGGSSSGSASAVAQGLADFGLGTDTGGSVRVPAFNCGIWGLRPSHGAISIEGVMPLAPSFDTIGIFTQDWETLRKVADSLLATKEIRSREQANIIFLEDAFSLADNSVQKALVPARNVLQQRFPSHSSSLKQLNLDVGKGFWDWYETYRINQWAEVKKTLCPWIDKYKPEFGPALTKTIVQVRNMDKETIPAAVAMREELCQRIQMALGTNNFLCLPTAPSVSPPKNNIPVRDHNPLGYYTKILSLTALAGIGRLPQISIPVATAEGCPVGISLVGPVHEDRQLIELAGCLVGFN